MQTKSPVSGHTSALKKNCSIVCLFFGFFLPTEKYVIHVYTGTKFHIILSMVAKRGLTNRANVHTTL